jgi:hypothetical protein
VARLTSIRVNDRSTNGEQKNLDGHGDVKRFREILRVLHVPDKRGNEGLTDKSVGDVQQSVDSLNESSTFRGPDGPAGRGLGFADESVRVVLNSVSYYSQNTSGICSATGMATA